MNWYSLKLAAEDPRFADPEEVGYKKEWGEHHGPVQYTPDTWNYGQRGYPDRSGPVPLPKKLYHVTPFPEEIMQEGFKSFSDMNQQTFGGHGTYTSFTSLENAKIYQEGLKDFARLANDEYGIWDLPQILNKWKVPRQKWDQMVSNAWSNIRDYFHVSRNKDIDEETLNDFSDIDKTMHEQGSFEKLEEFLDKHPEWTQESMLRIFEFMSIPSEGGFPLFMGTSKNLMNRLQGKSVDDIAILEAETPPLQWRSDVNIFDEDMSNRYTVNTGEEEWRVWNPQGIAKEKIRRIASNWYKKAQQNEAPIWQQNQRDYVGPWEERYGDDDEAYKDYVSRRKNWGIEIQQALSTGKISPEEARKAGYITTQFEKIKPLPEVLYHVTTAKTSVTNDAIKTRAELNQDFGMGLGGGDSDTVSFTTDIEIARTIKNSLLEAKRAASGDLSIQQMFDMAANGEGAEKPWLTRTISYWAENWKPGDEWPIFIKLLVQGYDLKQGNWPDTPEKMNAKEEKSGYPTGWEAYGEGWPHGTEEIRQTHYTQFIRKLSPEEMADKSMEIYKVWTAMREEAGGPENPLFFLSNAYGLSQVPDEEIAILQFQANPGSTGYQVSALGEWRTWSGNAVMLVGEVA